MNLTRIVRWNFKEKTLFNLPNLICGRIKFRLFLNSLGYPFLESSHFYQNFGFFFLDYGRFLLTHLKLLLKDFLRIFLGLGNEDFKQILKFNSLEMRLKRHLNIWFSLKFSSNNEPNLYNRNLLMLFVFEGVLSNMLNWTHESCHRILNFHSS